MTNSLCYAPVSNNSPISPTLPTWSHERVQTLQINSSHQGLVQSYLHFFVLVPCKVSITFYNRRMTFTAIEEPEDTYMYIPLENLEELRRT